MINFRAWVTKDDEMAMGSIASESNRGFIGSKEKFDPEMGSKFGKDGNIMVPSILQKLDYSGIDDNMKKKTNMNSSGFDDNLKGKSGDEATFNPFIFPIGQEQRSSQGSSGVGANSTNDKRTR